MKNFNGKVAEIIRVISACDFCHQGKIRQYLVIPGQQGPRWIIPSHSWLGHSVLQQWHPYNLSSRLKWEGILFLYSKGALKWMPGIRKVNMGSDNQDRNVSSQIAGLVPVVYVGTPGPHWKAVITLVSSDNGDPISILKVALSSEARTRLLSEAKILQNLTTANIPGIPSLLSAEKDGSCTLQTVVPGQLSSRKLTQAHIDWLLRLPLSGVTTSFQDQQECLLRDFDDKDLTMPDKAKVLVKEAMRCLRRKDRFPLVLTHGDFVPWNLKWQAFNKIAAIDWEEANSEGIPLFDICHFFFLQAHLFGSRNPYRKLVKSNLVNYYIKAIGLDNNYIVPLLILYILLMLSSRGEVKSESYKRFLLEQIPSVLE